MPNIFAGLDTPKWENPDEGSYKSSILGMQQAEQWHKQNDVAQAQNMEKLKFGLSLLQQHIAAQKQAVVADAFKDAGDNHLQQWEVVQQHPEYLLDPATSKGVQAILKGSMDYARTQAGSTEAKIALKQTEDFSKQLDALNGEDPETVAAIRSMQKAKDGSPSAQQWQALSLAQQRVQLQKKNDLAQAEIDARSRGDNVTVTTGPKGTTVTAKTPPPTKPNSGPVEPMLKTFPDGTSVIYNPKGGGFHVLQGNGQTKAMSTSELTKLYSTVDDAQWKKAIGEELKKRTGYTHDVPAPKGNDKDPLGILGK